MNGTIVAFPELERAATAAPLPEYTCASLAAHSDDLTAWRKIGDPAARAARHNAAAADALTKPIHSLCCARRQLDDAARIAGPHHVTAARFRTLIAMLDDAVEDMADLQTSLNPPQPTGGPNTTGNMA